jgi:hypothetical protein
LFGVRWYKMPFLSFFLVPDSLAEHLAFWQISPLFKDSKEYIKAIMMANYTNQGPLFISISTKLYAQPDNGGWTFVELKECPAPRMMQQDELQARAERSGVRTRPRRCSSFLQVCVPSVVSHAASTF